MSPTPHVLVQCILLLGAFTIALVFRGDSMKTVTVVVTGTGLLIASVFAAGYHVRRRRRLKRGYTISAMRLKEDKQMVLICALGFGVPLAFGVAMLAGLNIEGRVFHSDAATVACALPVVIMTAIVTSSAVDWYLIRPFQCGVLNEPLCSRAAEAPDEVRRRAYAKWWIAHRALCELISYTSAAALMAIAGAALAETIDPDEILKIAIGSFIGASAAVALGHYARGRAMKCLEYVQIQSAGLGDWAEGVDKKEDGQRLRGFVRDVSVHPGIQLCVEPDDPYFVPLDRAADVQDRGHPSSPLCPSGCRRWVERCDVHFREAEQMRGAPPEPNG